MMLLSELADVERQVEQLHMIFRICCSISTVCIVAAVLLFIVFHIPGILGELSGKTARKRIRELEKASENPYQRRRNKLFETGKGFPWDSADQPENRIFVAAEQDETEILE